jgi:hypothetical protein
MILLSFVLSLYVLKLQILVEKRNLAVATLNARIEELLPHGLSYVWFSTAKSDLDVLCSALGYRHEDLVALFDSGGFLSYGKTQAPKNTLCWDAKSASP